MAEKKFLVNLNLGGNKVTGAGDAVLANDLVTKQQLDAVAAGLSWKQSVLGIQLDATLDPSLANGARYIIGDPANLHANFGVIADVAKNDIVEYNGSNFIITFDASVLGEGYAVINKDDDSMHVFDGINWEIKTSDHVSADGTSLELDGLTMSIKDGGVTNAKLGAGSVTGDKIANNEITSDKISPLNITEALLASNAVTSSKIAADAVTKEKLAADVAGTGLTQDVDGSIKLADGYAATIGDNIATDIVVNHNLNTRDVVVQLYDTATYETVECGVVRTDANSITVSFNTAPATDSYRVIVKAILM